MALAYAKDESFALLKISGINHEWDNKIFKLAIERMSEGKENLFMMLNDEPYHILVKRDFITGWPSVSVYLPDYKDGVPLHSDEESKPNPQHLLTEYLQSQ